MILHARAYAKINFGLYVLRRREDGYHDIATVFHRINLYDSLAFEDADEIALRSTSADIPLGEDNLCWRCARALWQALGTDRGVTITLDKAIPVGAGLGGGSSDAAATLKALPRLWGVPASPALLHEIALSVGSDVPYFLHDGSAIGCGRGEQLEYFTLRLPYAVLVCNPGIHVATGWAYRQVHGDLNRTVPDLKQAMLEWSTPGAQATVLANDFEGPVFQEFPLIGALKQEILDAGARMALMSGSGSTVFGLFEDPARAAILAEQFRARGLTVSLTGPLFTPEPVDPPISLQRSL
jgi:4-diphosphocytidyl-2-C-methyl-D-erythritol kinase